MLEQTDSDTDGDASFFDDEVQHPPEHYLAAAANFNMRQLRQRRYSPNTRARLGWVKGHHNRYEPYLNRLS
jgi:hypothetical protein